MNQTIPNIKATKPKRAIGINKKPGKEQLKSKNKPKPIPMDIPIINSRLFRKGFSIQVETYDGFTNN